MKAEKKILVKEVYDCRDKSDYVYSADFSCVTVAAISALRKNLRGNSAECHIVINNILKLALAENGCEDLGDGCSEGDTTIIVGGEDLSGVVKTLFKFSKDNEERMGVKGGALSKHPLAASEITELSELPLLEVTPAQQLVRVCNAVPQGVVSVLRAMAKEI
jgi:ribosomal protein L10